MSKTIYATYIATDDNTDNAHDSEIILYCNSGSRSGVATNILKSMGYANTINGINKSNVIAKYGA